MLFGVPSRGDFLVALEKIEPSQVGCQNLIFNLFFGTNPIPFVQEASLTIEAGDWFQVRATLKSPKDGSTVYSMQLHKSISSRDWLRQRFEYAIWSTKPEATVTKYKVINNNFYALASDLNEKVTVVKSRKKAIEESQKHRHHSSFGSSRRIDRMVEALNEASR